ncbi:MAG: outer membrane lipoprotein carrier protein LolA [Candidatus Aminicenantes bacterium]|nr:outer membrane lipoprotein carrier protein LolA [Candidatus Aminicenantes bacterium]
MKCVVFYLILSLSGFSQNAADIASRTEQKLRSLISFQAEFKQVYYSSSVSTPLTEYGTVYYKRPGLMKWAYTEPEEKTVLLTENKIQYYFPEDNQLLIQDTTDEEQSNNIMSLLTGKTHILQDYDAETAEEDAAGSNYHIKLIPKYNDIENFILLDIDKKSLFIIKATFFDWAGNKQEFIFSRIQINRDMPDRTFDLIVPEDVEIIK